MPYVEMTPNNVEPMVKKAYDKLLSEMKVVQMCKCPLCYDLIDADNEFTKMHHLLDHAIDDRIAELWEAGKTLKEIDDLYHIFCSIIPDRPESRNSFLECHHNITKDNCFKISYLQCCDLPAYRISEITHSGKIRVCGVGGWSGAYSSLVSLGNLREPQPADKLYVHKRFS